MSVSPEYKELVEELFHPLGPVTIRRMFGGGGVFYRDLMFALIADETLFMKVDDTNRPDYEAAGQGPFTYETSKGSRAMNGYFQLPDELLDEPEELLDWARKSVDVAIRANTKKPKRPRKKKK